MTKAVFLDRDGVINRRAPLGKYITSWEEMRFLPGVSGAIALLNQAGFRVIVVSNQRCVALGLISAHDVDLMHQRMSAALAQAGARIDAVYYCPHDIEPPCDCRKPQPGMLLEAARAHGINLGESWMIGDSDSDIAAGKSAGCKTARLLRPNEPAYGGATLVASSLLDVANRIV